MLTPIKSFDGHSFIELPSPIFQNHNNQFGGQVVLAVRDAIVHVNYSEENDEFEAIIPGLPKNIPSPRSMTIADLAERAGVLIEMMKLEASDAEAKRRERKNKKAEYQVGVLE